MNRKYLYGKREHLQAVIDGEKTPRFSDLSHFSRLENDLIRDDEAYRIIELDRADTIITINSHTISPDSLACNPKVSMATRHCFCLCLSKSGDDKLLYETFKADVCIELNIDLLLEIIKTAVLPKFPGMKVMGKDVSYFPVMSPELFNLSADDLVFQKDNRFAHEQEYRIALFYPLDKKGFKSVCGEDVPFHKQDESQHMTIETTVDTGFKDLILNIYEPRK